MMLHFWINFPKALTTGRGYTNLSQLPKAVEKKVLFSESLCDTEIQE